MEPQIPDPVVSLGYPVGIRSDNMTDDETKITVHNERQVHQWADFTVRQADGSVLFTAEGNAGEPSSQKREFKDASGLPLFVLRRHYWTFSSAWYIELPGGGAEDTFKGRLRTYVRRPKVDFTIKNLVAASADSKEDSSKSATPEVLLQLRCQNTTRFDTHILIDGKKVMHICQTNSTMSSGKNVASSKPGWQVTVAAGMDLCLAAIATVILAELKEYND